MREVSVVSLNVDPDNIITKEKLGLCSGNFVNLVKDTKELIVNANLRKEMGLRSRDYAIRNYSLQNLEKIVDFLEK